MPLCVPLIIPQADELAMVPFSTYQRHARLSTGEFRPSVWLARCVCSVVLAAALLERPGRQGAAWKAATPALAPVAGQVRPALERFYPDSSVPRPCYR